MEEPLPGIVLPRLVAMAPERLVAAERPPLCAGLAGISR